MPVHSLEPLWLASRRTGGNRPNVVYDTLMRRKTRNRIATCGGECWPHRPAYCAEGEIVDPAEKRVIIAWTAWAVAIAVLSYIYW
jgi:hypothetical protein